MSSSTDQIRVLLWGFSGVANSLSGAGLVDTPASNMGILKRVLKETHLKISCMHAVRLNLLLLQCSYMYTTLSYYTTLRICTSAQRRAGSHPELPAALQTLRSLDETVLQARSRLSQLPSHLWAQDS